MIPADIQFEIDFVAQRCGDAFYAVQLASVTAWLSVDPLAASSPGRRRARCAMRPRIEGTLTGDPRTKRRRKRRSQLRERTSHVMRLSWRYPAPPWTVKPLSMLVFLGRFAPL
jgi:hypothetical protein